MEQESNPLRPEALTDERASSLNPSPAGCCAPGGSHVARQPKLASREATGTVRAVGSGGVRAAGDIAPPHLPFDFSMDLDRDGRAPGLVSNKLFDPSPPVVAAEEEPLARTALGPGTPPGAPARAARHDGFTVAAEQHFLRILAETGVVADACHATGISRPTAYNRRNSAAGRAFALAWDAALLLSRRAIADDVMSRARHGVIDRVYRDGALVAERHRYDNRLTMAVLTRLDRIAERHGANAPAVNAVADEFDLFVGSLPDGLEAAEDFIAARCPDPAAGADAPSGPLAQGGEEALLARLANYEAYGGGLPDEIDTADLDPAAMESWTEAELDRAYAAHFLSALAPHEWPAAARDSSADGTDGMCKVRKIYLCFHPPRPAAEARQREDDFAGCEVWEDEDRGWLTDFLPPPGFDGYEEGDPDGSDYRRELAPEERALIDADVAEVEASERAEREAARDRFFALDAPEPPHGGDDGHGDGPG